MRIILSDKLAIVTGSTAGIGLAIAKGLVGTGATVVINGLSQHSVDQAIDVIKALHPQAKLRGVVADLGTAEGCAALVAAEPQADILVNNVGFFQQKDFFETEDSEWNHIFEVNVMSGVRLARAYAKQMVEHGWGRVVFLSSESALNIPADMIHYGFSKTANLAVSRGLAKRLSGTNVTVNSVMPSVTITEGANKIFSDIADKSGISIEEAGIEFVRQQRPSSIIQRPTTPQEIANLVVYICSEQASATTGAALRVDGGVLDTLT